MRATWLIALAVIGCETPSRLDPAPSVDFDPKPEAQTPKPETQPAKPVTVTFVGDVNLSLFVGIRLAEKGTADGFPFSHVAGRLKAADMLVGNLECVASYAGSHVTKRNPFRCPLAIDVMLDAGFDLVSVANNHALDFGKTGFEDMLRNLEAKGLPHFGKETFNRSPQAPFIKMVGGIRIGFLGYFYPPDEPFTDVIEARPQVDVLFAFMHWGRDDESKPLPLQRRLARKLIDAGVDCVVGTHAHVVQPTESYKGRLIAYGLGNFVFSGMTHTELHRIGQVLEVDISKDGGIVGQRVIEVRLGG